MYGITHLGIEPLIRIIVPVQSKQTTSGPALMVRRRLAEGNGVWVCRTAAETGYHFAGEQPNARRVHPHVMGHKPDASNTHKRGEEREGQRRRGKETKKRRARQRQRVRDRGTEGRPPLNSQHSNTGEKVPKQNQEPRTKLSICDLGLQAIRRHGSVDLCPLSADSLKSNARRLPVNLRLVDIWLLHIPLLPYASDQATAEPSAQASSGSEYQI